MKDKIDNEATQETTARRKPSPRILIELGLLVLLILIIFLILKVSIVGWLFLIGVVVALYFIFIGRFFYKWINRIILLVVSFLFLFLIGTLTSGSSGGNGSGNGNGAGAGDRDISGFVIEAGGDWQVDIKEEDDLYVITKIDGARTASVDAWYNKLDQSIYKEKEIDFDKVTMYGYSGFNKISEDRIKIGKWNCVRMLLDANIKVGDVGYYRYFYLVDVPGNRDIMVLIGAGGLDYIKSLGTEWEGYISKIKLNY